MSSSPRKKLKPDGLLLLLAQSLPGFQPTVANDVDPNQDNLVHLENAYDVKFEQSRQIQVKQSNKIVANNVDPNQDNLVHLLMFCLTNITERVPRKQNAFMMCFYTCLHCTQK